MAKENNNSNKRAFENAVEPVTKRRALQDTTNIPQSSTSLINLQKPQQPEYFDIDKNNVKDPSYVTSYSQDIYFHLYSSESIIRNYIHAQKHLNQGMRKTLMNWLSDVVVQYGLSPQSLFLGKKITDTILSKILFVIDDLQLLGVTSLFIASKFEDVNPPPIDELTYISDFSCSQEKIKNLEVVILNTLSYDITIPTEIDFLPRYLTAATYNLSERDKSRICLLANYYCELTILYYTFLKYKSSTIAIVSVSLALATLGANVWTPTLDHYFPYRDYNFIQCMSELLQHIRLEDDNNIRQKYAQPHFGRVSTLPVPDAVPYFNIR